MPLSNRRVFYAVQQVGVSKCGLNTYTSIHGLQSVGVNTKYNLEQVFEIGKVSLYANIENIPDVEVTLQKVLDGRPLIYHLLTNGSTSATLVGRSAVRATLGLSIYQDTQDAASGTPISQCVMSGVYVSSLSYTFPTQGDFTEDVTAVGNNKTWLSSFTATAFTTTDAPLYSGGGGLAVARRQDIIFGTGVNACVLPRDIPGVDANGKNPSQSDGSFAAHIQSIKTSVNLGRDALYELGRRGVYYRYAQFPTAVQTDFEVNDSSGDSVEALEDSYNIRDNQITIKTLEGTAIDLGPYNKLSGVNRTGGNAGQQGGNASLTYSYTTFNDMTVTHPQDPSGL